MPIKVKDIINHYSIEINIDGKVEKKVIEYPVVACKEYYDYSKSVKRQGQYIVLDSNSYTVLKTIYNKYESKSVLENANVWEMKWSSRTLKDYVKGSIYTTETDNKKVYAKLKKEIEKYIKKEYGRYGNYIDLLSKIEI